MGRRLAFLLVLLIPACTGVPEGVAVVEGFERERYLGKWYEIARLDHSFERGLSRVTAEYSLREDGGIRVVNRGFDVETGKWEEAVGKAYFVEEPDVGRLKVSFFGPFYGAYNIIALDKQAYSYAMVAGPTRSYLWILSRTKRLDQDVQERLVDKAARLGFATERLIFVAHEASD